MHDLNGTVETARRQSLKDAELVFGLKSLDSDEICFEF